MWLTDTHISWFQRGRKFLVFSIAFGIAWWLWKHIHFFPTLLLWYTFTIYWTAIVTICALTIRNNCYEFWTRSWRISNGTTCVPITRWKIATGCFAYITASYFTKITCSNFLRCRCKCCWCGDNRSNGICLNRWLSLRYCCSSCRSRCCNSIILNFSLNF